MTYQTRISALKIGGKTVEQEQDEVDVNNPKADAAIGDLNKDLNETFYKIISSSPKLFAAIHPQDFTENFYITKEELKSYVKGFFRAVSQNVDIAIKENDESSVNSELFLDTALDDIDIKLSLYRSFKSIYDKWIARGLSGELKYFYNVNGESKSLFDHFRFIDRANNDIGGKAVIDIAMLSNLANTKGGGGPTKTLYQTVTDILSKNNFDFYPLPGEVDFSTKSMSDEELELLFKASDNLSNVPTSPSFVGMYMGGSSRFVDITRKNNNCSLVNNVDYVDDSFDISEIIDLPEEFSVNADSNIDKGIAVLEVKYGQQNQNHFLNIQLDQTEFKETQESLKIIEVLTNPKDGSSPGKSGKGNNLYDVYLTRSYNCTVESLGNMSIQPLMYFVLKNTPMFHGTYLITEVKHDIKPHFSKTTFKGMRQPKITIPIVVDALSLLDLSLIGQVEDEIGQSLSDIGINLNSTNTFFGTSDIKQFTSQEKVEKGCEIARRLVVDLGLTSAQACGIVGNLIAESSLIPDRIQETNQYYNSGGQRPRTGLITESGGWNGSTFPKGAAVLGYGWAQWTYYSLKNEFIEYANNNGFNLLTTPANDEISYGYLVHWVSKSSDKLNKLKAKNSVYDSAVFFAVEYERCGACGQKESQQKRAGFAQQVFDYCNGNVVSNSGNLTPAKELNCTKPVKIGLNGSGTLDGALNIIVGSSSVGTLNGIKSDSTYGGLNSNNIYVYYNCSGKRLSWLSSQVIADTNVYSSVKSYFQVGIGTNDGYPVSDSEKEKIQTYTSAVKQRFPNTNLYVFPGTYGWGSVKGSEFTKQRLKNYYKQYTDLGWVLLWPTKNSVELDPKFSSSSGAHKSSGDWFQFQMKLLKQYSV